jgi:sugar-phosphatase
VKIECAGLPFDVDGSLVDSTAAAERSWRRWCTEYGADPETVLEVCHGRRSEDTVAEFVGPAERPAAVALLKRLELTDLDGVVACPGAAELLAALAGRDTLPWGLVTSCGVDLVTARMTAAGLPLPTVMITAERVRQGKPDPGATGSGRRRSGAAGGLRGAGGRARRRRLRAGGGRHRRRGHHDLPGRRARRRARRARVAGAAAAGARRPGPRPHALTDPTR